MGAYKILDWDKLFPYGREPVITEKEAKIMGTAIAYYLTKPCIDIQNTYRDWLKPDKHLQNFRQTREAYFSNATQIQNLSTTSSFESTMEELKSKFIDMPTYDEGYRMIFREIPLDGSDNWTVETVSSSITFSKILPGGDIKYYGHTDTKYAVYVDFYGAGYGVDRRLILSRRWYRIEDGLAALRNAAFKKKAQIAYALIEAVSSAQNITWQTTGVATTDAKYQATRDALTMNAGAQGIIANCKDKGIMPNPLGSTFVILCDYRDIGRIKNAMNLSLQEYDSSKKTVDYSFVMVPTTLLTSTTYYYIILPKGKLEMAELLALTQFQQFNQTNFTEQIADWIAYAFNIGDIQQIQRCAKA